METKRAAAGRGRGSPAGEEGVKRGSESEKEKKSFPQLPVCYQVTQQHCRAKRRGRRERKKKTQKKRRVTSELLPRVIFIVFVILKISQHPL